MSGLKFADVLAAKRIVNREYREVVPRSEIHDPREDCDCLNCWFARTFPPLHAEGHAR